MPHQYNTRRKDINSENVAETVSGTILNSFLSSQFESMESNGAENEQQEAASASTVKQNSSKTTKKGKQSKKRVTAAGLVTAIDRLSDKIDAIDKRVEQQELRNSGLSISGRPSAHSSPKADSISIVSSARNHSRGSKRMPSPRRLRDDQRTQRKVSRRMAQYDSKTRQDESGTSPVKPIKSGRYRLGDQKVKVLVDWPHEAVPINEEFKTPSYEELSPMQFCQGLAMNIYWEKDEATRDVMLLHFAQTMQDAQDLNFRTAKRSHANVLSEIERGQLVWSDEPGVDRARQRYTQRTLKVKGDVSKSHDNLQTKICRKYNEGRCKKDPVHVEGKIKFVHSCFQCFRATKDNLPHPEYQCPRLRGQTSANGNKQQV